MNKKAEQNASRDGGTLDVTNAAQVQEMTGAGATPATTPAAK
jgi:hypothetical protein